MPEWPIGIALKAIVGGNVNRGFESRPLCHTESWDVTKYRLTRAIALGFAGINFVAAGAAAVIAFLLAPADNWLRFIGIGAAVIGIVALAFALRWVFLPPVIARLGPTRLVIGRQHSERIDVAWTEIENVAVEGEGRTRSLRVDLSDGQAGRFGLMMIEPRGDEFMREIHERLNTAHGYRRLN